VRITIINFSGLVPKQSPLLLADNQAQVALNTRLWTGALEPFSSPSTTKTGLSGTRTSIYRFGQDTPGDANYWLTWDNHVHVVKGPIAGDTTERTYFTGDGYPRVTNNELALSSQPYPGASYKLGVPAPTGAPSATVDGPANIKTIDVTRYSDGKVKTTTTNPDGSVSTVTTGSTGITQTTTTGETTP
jgi:hypothetical protein